ncbi:AIPR family protein [uncultured Fibrobacter sp.]|uniref:AIPR family protein n=1 Tax=uncultured Fibrobacter sp. TaxID=261512 RepID=UPI0025EBFB84|nr:AIPR family protein [uncultured Fibrobacter sp.]
MNDIQDYKKEFLRRLRDESAINGTDTEDEFINHILDLLSDYDDLQSPQRVNCGDKTCSNNRKMRIDGYSIDDADHTLILFISDFEDAEETSKLTSTRVDELYWRMFFFLDEACNKNISNYFDDSDEMLDVASFIKGKINNPNNDDPEKILKIKFLILTNKELDTKLMNQDLMKAPKAKGRKKTKSTKKIKKDNFNDMPLEIDLWHIERIYDQEKNNLTETVHIDFEKDYNVEGIPCIKGNLGNNLGYQAYIAIIPGKLLADIYIDYGSKVLEGNVRAFLGTGGAKSVNSGIRRTINNEPQNFFTYNNGIAATAANIEFTKQDTQLYITEIDDLQIINGGQTTASLAEAVLNKNNTNRSLEGIFVPMKLTVIENRETENEDGVSFYDKMVQDIAKYANSQNKVTAADLFSNDPFHIKMERMSKTYLAPPRRFAVPTAWYYERARKKYKQEQLKLQGENLKRFLAKYPKEQIVTKEQLAMYLTTVNQRPDIVAKGKNFVIKEFNQNVKQIFGKNKDLFNEFFFHKCIASAIIFRTVDDYLEKNKDSAKKPTGFWYKAGGFKMDIVPYAIAKIINCIPEDQSIDWEKIWQMQKIGPGFMKEVERATKFTNDFICDCNGMIVSEYCKKASTWEKFKEKPYTLKDAFVDELIPLSMVKKQELEASKDKKENDGLKALVDFVKPGPQYWTAVMQLAEAHGVGSNAERSSLLKAISYVKKYTLPKTNFIPIAVKTMMDDCYAVKEKLISLGVKVK